ncbi:ABC transporter permease [candidate division KSB1 bacterium]|nr:ABC transporter permease [candidate division KSB1 bacterium]
MKLISIIKKSLKEQLRNFWILVLTVSMAPFFVFVYYLITEASKPYYVLLVVNLDEGVGLSSGEVNYGTLLIQATKSVKKDSIGIPLKIQTAKNRTEAIIRLKNKKADVLILIPENFSRSIHNLTTTKINTSINIEFIGDLTNVNYMIGAIWANELLNDFIFEATQKTKLLKIKETSLGISGRVDDFNLCVPGLLILSVIMLMFSATIAIITEVENKTMLRLKLSKISSFEFLTGVSFIQVLIGIISIFLTLIVAVFLGFEYAGSILILILIAVLTSISIIAFSLILAAFTKTVNEVLIVGNFPLFLFMFFTGAAFPMDGKEIFSIGGYSISLQGLMSPTHSISALNKVLILNMGFKNILPEIIVLVLLTVIYFVIGVLMFQRRHMKVV